MTATCLSDAQHYLHSAQQQRNPRSALILFGKLIFVFLCYTFTPWIWLTHRCKWHSHKLLRVLTIMLLNILQISLEAVSFHYIRMLFRDSFPQTAPHLGIPSKTLLLIVVLNTLWYWQTCFLQTNVICIISKANALILPTRNTTRIKRGNFLENVIFFSIEINYSQIFQRCRMQKCQFEFPQFICIELNEGRQWNKENHVKNTL